LVDFVLGILSGKKPEEEKKNAPNPTQKDEKSKDDGEEEHPTTLKR